MRIARRQWLCALSAALMVHIGVAVTLLWEPEESGAVAAGIGGVEFSLGPAGGAPGGEAQASEEVAEADTVQPDSTVTPTEETAEATDTIEPEQTEVIETEVASAVTEEPQESPVEPPQTVPVQRVEPIETQTAARWTLSDDTPLEQIETVQPDQIMPITTESTTVPPILQSAAIPPVDSLLPEPIQPPVEEQPIETAEPEPQQPVTAEAVTNDAPPVPRRRPAEPPKEVVKPAPTRQVAQASVVTAGETNQVARVTPSVAGSAGKAGTETNRQAGSGDASSGGGLPGAEADYMALLQAWLEKHKEYPRRAQLRRQEGTALLYFVMDREGRVITHRLQESSGHRLLDREVEEMIRRAQPLPKMPDDMERAQLELVVPVQFFLR